MLYSQVSETAVSLFWLAFRLVTSANNDSREYNSYRVKYNISKKKYFRYKWNYDGCGLIVFIQKAVKFIGEL